MRSIILGIFLFVSFVANSQKDTATINRLIDKCVAYRYTDFDTTLFFAHQVINASRKLDYHHGLAKGYYFAGDAHQGKSELSESVDYLDSAINYASKHQENEVFVDANTLKGIIYSDLGEYDKSIEFYTKSLAKAEEVGYDRGVVIAKSNIGVTNYFRGEFEKALDYWISCLDDFLAMKDTHNYLICLGNVSSTYSDIGLYDECLEMLAEGMQMIEGNDEYMVSYSELLSQKALVFSKQKKHKEAISIYLECVAIKKRYGDLRGVSRIYNNIAEVYFGVGKPNKAFPYAERAIELADSLGFKRDLAFYNKTLAYCFNEAGDDARAKKYVLNSIKMSEEIGALDDLKDAYSLSAKIHSGLGDYQKAFLYQSKMVALKDSLEKAQSAKTLEELATLHQLDKKELENEKLKEENEKERLSGLLKDEQLEKDRAQKMYMGIGLGLMLVLATIIFRAYQNKKKTNSLISEQKEQIEAQHIELEETYTEIKDSINYAQRIQNAILPSPDFWNDHLANSYVLYLPKDVVAGDFYWMEMEEGDVFFAAADCTGHGVPGAMVSVVCNNALNRSIREFGLKDPGEILDKVTDLVIETFEKSGEEVKDGMDISLCKLNGKQLEFAGAHNPLWLIRKDELEGFEPNMELDGLKLYEVKADKQPVGKFAHRTNFTTHKILLQPGDQIIISSDGYPDQFGGDKGKKLKSKGFKKLVMQMSGLSIADQKSEMQKYFESWKGTFEQLDDVCVISFKV